MPFIESAARSGGMKRREGAVRDGEKTLERTISSARESLLTGLGRTQDAAAERIGSPLSGIDVAGGTMARIDPPAVRTAAATWRVERRPRTS